MYNGDIVCTWKFYIRTHHIKGMVSPSYYMYIIIYYNLYICVCGHTNGQHA